MILTKTLRLKLFFIITAISLLTSCGTGSYTWGWFAVSPLSKVGQQNLSFLVKGLIPTITVSLISIAISVSLGLLLAIFALSRFRILKSVHRIWIEIFRSVPVLVMLLWVYYGLPISTGLDLGIMAAAIISLALTDSAFEAEIFRAGIKSIPKSQHEAARIMGCNEFQVLRHVILPQTIRNILPPLVNQFAYMLKISSIASVIGLGELTRKANELTVIEYRPLEIYTILIIEYLVLVLIVSFFARKIEIKLDMGREE
jgi:His/Glu/Gln/Arg/opine family amino acid ABC transporter permease subunit